MILDSYKLKTKRMSLIHWICWSKFLLKSQRINLHQIRILKAHLHEQNCLQTDVTMNRTIPSNSETSMRIRSRKNWNFGCTSETIYLTITYCRTVTPLKQIRFDRNCQTDSAKQYHNYLIICQKTASGIEWSIQLASIWNWIYLIWKPW